MILQYKSSVMETFSKEFFHSQFILLLINFIQNEFYFFKLKIYIGSFICLSVDHCRLPEALRNVPSMKKGQTTEEST